MPKQRMAPPPKTPNAVSTLAAPDDTMHRAEPIPFTCSPAAAMAAVEAAVARLPRADIREREDRYLRLVVSSRVFRFKDDVELQIDADAGLIHYRSAARLGKGDFGVNRKRMEGVARDILVALPT